MKYLTKDELDIIADRLLKNPTREELKKLSDEYNVEVVEQVLEEHTDKVLEPKPKVDNVSPDNDVISSTMESSKNFGGIHVPPSKEEITPNPEVEENVVVPSTIPMPSEQINNGTKVSQQIPSLEVPKYVIPNEVEKKSNNLNSSPLNFNGNLFEQPNNMMETTDNFDSSRSFDLFEQPSNTSVNKPPFTSGPSMFGQIQNGQ